MAAQNNSCVLCKLRCCSQAPQLESGQCRCDVEHPLVILASIWGSNTTCLCLGSALEKQAPPLPASIERLLSSGSFMNSTPVILLPVRSSSTAKHANLSTDGFGSQLVVTSDDNDLQVSTSVSLSLQHSREEIRDTKEPPLLGTAHSDGPAELLHTADTSTVCMALQSQTRLALTSYFVLTRRGF